ncbi:MAG: hypothetical protein GY819_09675 [Planctomycetaceae bacterium]|nr:hypothetical protein [Planctomycetaceae bacterium]MCP4463050.1 hypothetical protein [Planctomycetaceae bacterium]MDG1807552.1 hypothetical protein [Pirellulaceae bacterium]MDG2105839.1 hypothetical protein [Pirellulaceae bacterium]
MKYVPSSTRFRYPISLCLVVLTGFFVAPEIIAQRLIPPVRLSGMDPGIGVIMDTTMFSTGTRVAVQVTLENGIKKTRAEENGIKTYIEELVEGGILMRVTRQYGPDDRDLLMEKHPDLYMSAKDFPATTEGAERVEVTIGVTQKIEVASIDELKLKHPEAYQSYLKYTQPNNGMRILRGRFGDAILTPEIRIDTDLDGESVRVVPPKTEGPQTVMPPESPVEVKDPAAPQTDKPAGKDHKSK